MRAQRKETTVGAVGAALIKAGLTKEVWEARAAAQKFIESGGNREAWIEAYDFAAAKSGSGQDVIVHKDLHPCAAPASKPMPSGGHYRDVQQDQTRPADARQPMPEGQTHHVQQDQPLSADGQPIASGGDQPSAVQQDQITSASPARGQTAEKGQKARVGNDQITCADLRHPIASGKAHTPSARTSLSASAPPAREPSAADIDALKESGDFTYFQMIKLRAKAWSTYRYKDLKNVRALNMKENIVINDVIDWGRQNRIKDDSLVSLTMPVNEMKRIQRRAATTIHTKAEVISKTAKRSADRGR